MGEEGRSVKSEGCGWEEREKETIQGKSLQTNGVLFTLRENCTYSISTNFVSISQVIGTFYCTGVHRQW